MITSILGDQLAGAVQSATEYALEAWRGRYAGADMLEDALGAHVDEVHVSYQLKRSRTLWVQVAVICKRRPYKSDVYTMRLTSAGAGWKLIH